MFKNIQKYLLVNHPLLWNLKVVPLAFFLIIFNIIFFLIGLYNGALDFSESNNNYNYNFNEPTIIFFSILVSILTLIIWIAYYFKNNSFKTYYPKTNFSLFKEWFFIFISCLLLSTFVVCFLVGKDVRVRSYYTEKEAKKRCETLSLGSYFLENSYENYQYSENTTQIDSNTGIANKKIINYVLFQGKKYSLNSLYNKNLSTFTFFDQSQDSLHKIRIKNWLANNQKDSVEVLFKNYLAIADEHKLKSSIDEKKWLQLVYDYPTFENYKNIGKKESDYEYAAKYAERNNYAPAKAILPKIDTTSQRIKIIGNQEYIFNKYYVPANKLEYSYSKISESYNHPSINFKTFIIPIYIAFVLSLFLFSFRTSTGKNWLIALVSLGVLNIIIAIFTALFSSSITYLITVLATILAAFIYFIIVLNRKQGKGISGITLNTLLWLLPSFLPIIYYLTIEFMKISSNYYSVDYNVRDQSYPTISMLEDNSTYLFYGNILFIFLAMVFFSITIKKWKGLAES